MITDAESRVGPYRSPDVTRLTSEVALLEVRRDELLGEVARLEALRARRSRSLRRSLESSLGLETIVVLASLLVGAACGAEVVVWSFAAWASLTAVICRAVEPVESRDLFDDGVIS